MKFDDPEEYVGKDHATKADPKGAKRAAPAPVIAPLAAPAPSVAVYNPPGPDEAHPKTARLGPALRLDNAEAALNSAQAELQAATSHLRSCELIEAEALSALIKATPGPTADEVHRKMLADDTARKLERVAQGLPVVEPRKPTHGNSPVDIAAASRPRTSAQMANAPLRSNVARRLV
jgi:hypothetical protein